MDKKLNLKSSKAAFGVSDKSVRNWIDAGMPCEKGQKGYLFDLSACIKWREEYLQESKQGSDEYERAKTEREVYRAKTARLNYEKMSGLLVYAADVERIAFGKARQIRDSLLNIPDRISDILTGEINKDGRIDKVKVNEILMREIRQVLEDLSGGTPNAN